MWQILVASRVVIGYCLGPILIKRITGLPSRTRRLTWQFGFCFVFSLMLGIATQESFLRLSLMPIFIFGIFNSFAAYCQWRAVDVSMSKNALFAQGDDLIALSLGYVLLNEAQVLNGILIAGILLCVVSAVAFSLMGNRGAEKTSSSIIPWVAVYSVIWGVGVFLMRYFAKEDVAFPSFITAWYGGSFLGAFFIGKLMGIQEAGARLDPKGMLGVGILAITVWTSLILNYLALGQAPITIVQPIFQVGEMVFPLIIGLWLFKESRQVTPPQKAVMVTGLAGVAIIATQFIA